MRKSKFFIAGCMLAAVSTVAIGGTGASLVQANSSSYIMDSEETQNDIPSGVSESNFDFAEGVSGEEQEKLFQEYEKSGIYEKDGVLYYHDEPVRYFADTSKVVEVNEAGGKTITSSNICTYVNWDGTIDLYTVRKETTGTTEDNKVYGDIESVELASSISDVIPFVSAQSLAKIVEAGYEAEGISAVYELLPYVPQEAVSEFAKKAAGNGDYDEVNDLVQFLSEETVAEIADSEYERTGVSNIGGLLPFLSQESLSVLAKKAVARGDYDGLEQLAFYVESQLIDEIARELESKGERFAGIASFMSGPALEEVVQSAFEKAGASALYEMLPILPKSWINKYIKKAAAQNDYDGVEKMAPYAGRKVLKKIEEEMLALGISTEGIEEYL